MPLSRQREHLVTIPGVGQSDRPGDRRRDRRRHESLPDRRTPGLVGRRVPGATTNRPANIAPARPVTATGGYRSAGQAGLAAAAPKTPPTSALDTAVSPVARGRRKPLSPWNTRFWIAVWHMLTTTSSTPISAATTSPGSTLNAPCAASFAKPTRSDSPCASTQSRPPDHPHQVGTAPETSITLAAGLDLRAGRPGRVLRSIFAADSSVDADSMISRCNWAVARGETRRSRCCITRSRARRHDSKSSSARKSASTMSGRCVVVNATSHRLCNRGIVSRASNRL